MLMFLKIGKEMSPQQMYERKRYCVTAMEESKEYMWKIYNKNIFYIRNHDVRNSCPSKPFSLNSLRNSSSYPDIF